MKSEHRHELETNTLSRELAAWIERIKPHTTSIFVGIAILAGLYLAAMWWSSERAELDRRFWEEFQVKLTDADPEYEEIRRLADSDDFAGATGQEWAYLTWADRQLLHASHEYLQSRSAAMERLTNVAGVYDTLASSAASEEIANRARYGLARVYEMQNKIDEALREYNMVRGPLAELAAERAERLQDERSREAVQWLATAELPQATPEVSNPALGQAPDFNVIPPSAGTPSGPNLDLSRSLDEILGELVTEEAESERYDDNADEAESPDQETSEETPPAENGDAGSDPGSDAAQPGGTDAGQQPEASAPVDDTETPATDDATDDATDEQ